MRAMVGATKLGIEKAAGFASRAVLLDFVRYFDEGPWVLGGRNVTGADLQGACDAEGVEIQSGDIVLLRFGYLDLWWAQNGEVGFDQPGLGLDGAEWLAAKDVIAVGADNAAVECVPFDGNDFLAVHKVLLVATASTCSSSSTSPRRHATSAGRGSSRSAPLKVTGATGSPINPIFVG